MKRFSFRLDPVLKSRTEKEEKAILSQAEALKIYQHELQVLEKICANLKEAMESTSSKMTAGDCIAKSLYLSYLEESKAAQEIVVKNAGEELEKKRRAVIEARKDKLVLEKLKEKKYQSYMKLVSYVEAKVDDDRSTALAYRRKGG